MKKEKNETKSVYSNKLMTVGIIMIIVIGIVFGYFSADLYNRFYVANNKKSNEEIVTQVKQNTDNQAVVEKDAVIIYQRVYTKCNHMITEEITAEEKYVGLTKEEIENSFIQWEVKEFSANKIVLEKNIKSYSPDYYKIGTNVVNGEEVVAVYNYDLEGNEILEYSTNTPISLLSEVEKDKLSKGIYVKNKEYLYNLLENYDE